MRPWIVRPGGPWLPPFLIDGRMVQFNPTERDIFAVLFNARGKVVDTVRIHDAVWERRKDLPEDIAHTFMVHMSRLRDVLVPTRFRVQNWHGQGYRLIRVERKSQRIVRKAA